MTPDPPAASFALLTNGAGFSCAVLQALVDCRYRPGLLVMPEYPPAPRPHDSPFDPLLQGERRRLLELAGEVEVAYAPVALQRNLAQTIRQRAIDFLLVACWPYLIDREVYESAACAALNLHPSLLPRYRGPDPLGEQLAKGDAAFGVTLHRLDAHFDSGDIIAQSGLADIGAAASRPLLEIRCAELGVELFIEAIAAYPEWNPLEQPG